MDKKVLILSASPRKGGNSETLCAEFTRGAEESRNTVEMVRLHGKKMGFCTACYREGRTGDRFMSLCKSGQIQNCCHPNALMTLKEYLMDYSSQETRRIGEALIEKEIGSIPKEKVQQIVRDNLAKIEQGVRDFRFYTIKQGVRGFGF